MTERWEIREGHVLDVLRQMPERSINVCVTSPPFYMLRNYGLPPSTWDDGWNGCLGLEPTVEQFVSHIVEVFSEVNRVLRDDGTLWVEIGDSFGGGAGGRGDSGNPIDGKPVTVKHSAARLPRGGEQGQLLGVPWRVAFALQAAGWILRSDTIWQYASPMPESVNGTRWTRCRVKTASMSKDDPRYRHGMANGRAAQSCTTPTATEWADCPGCAKCAPNNGLILRRGSWRPTRAHSYVFLFAKTNRYFCDAEAVREPCQSGIGGAAFGNVTNQLDALDADAQARRCTTADRERYIATGRNPRSVWKISSEPLSLPHFAAFPSELPRRCLLAGLSEKGYCPTCGAPWARIVDARFEQIQAGVRSDSKWPESNNRGSAPRGVIAGETTGWRPTCTCLPAEPIPGLALDPFAGSGTTILTARRMGHRGIGIELSADYAAMARKRIRDDAPLFNGVSA